MALESDGKVENCLIAYRASDHARKCLLEYIYKENAEHGQPRQRGLDTENY